MWLISLVLFLIIVGFAGWLAGRLIYGKGLGLIRSVGCGLFGAFLSFVVLGLFGIQVQSFAGMLLASFAGALAILIAIKAIGRASARVFGKQELST